MSGRIRIQLLPVFTALIGTAAFALFYIVYVPLVKSFQAVLVPLLLAALLFTLWKIEWGVLFTVFAFPLINNLPYFFGIYELVPQAPTALVLMLVFLLGGLLRRCFLPSKPDLDHPLFKPLTLFFFIVLTSAAVTFWRYTNLSPVFAGGIHEFIVNVDGLRAGGALMSVVFSSLNYLTGLGFFAVLYVTIRSKTQIKILVLILFLSTLLSVTFSLIQKYHSPHLGNTPLWENMNQINGTFKDPNSFGAFLSAVLLVLIGMVFGLPGKLKFFPLLTIIPIVIVFPSIGSRSGFLAVFVGLAVFIGLSRSSSPKAGLRKKILLTLSAAVLVAVLILAFFSPSNSVLGRRLRWSRGFLTGDVSINELFSAKLDSWSAACSMAKDYTLTGVGTGAYIVELPNYLQPARLSSRATDSAENHFFQAISELGLMGVLILAWVALEMVKEIRKAMIESRAQGNNRFLLFGLVSGLAALGVNFLFHSYIGGFEVKYTFWLLMALVVAWPKNNCPARGKKELGDRFKVVLFGSFLLYGIVHLWHAAHSLSPGNRAVEFGWNQNYGGYDPETDRTGAEFRWMKKNAALTIENRGPILVLPIKVSHPDVEQNPVEVRIFLGNQNMRKTRLLQKVVFKTGDWIHFEYVMPDAATSKILLILETNRAWKPRKRLGTADTRTLAVAIGKEWFRYPTNLRREQIRAVRTIPARNWLGEYGANLITLGTSALKFSLDDGPLALRLNAKAQSAFGIGPYLVIRLDDKIIGKTVLAGDDWTSFVLKPEIEAQQNGHVLTVEYVNDVYDPGTGQDRNLFLGDLEILSLSPVAEKAPL